MPRVHLFELEDQTWFPSFIRNYGTDFLQFMAHKTKMYDPIIPLLASALKSLGLSHIVDIGSGGGGGIVLINEELKKEIPDLKITLTDYYPNIPAFEYISKSVDNIDFVKGPVDARAVPLNLKGLRTQFISFHHFKPQDARLILQNAVDAKSGIAVFEVQERSVKNFIAMFLAPILVLLVTPFIRPFSIGRIIFTYLIPIVPLFVLWDGLVSCLRTYSPKELRAIIEQLEDHENFDWKIEKRQSGPQKVICLVGLPI